MKLRLLSGVIQLLNVQILIKETSSKLNIKQGCCTHNFRKNWDTYMIVDTLTIPHTSS